MSWYERVWRPWLFRLPADQAHELGKLAFRLRAPWSLLGAAARRDYLALHTELAGIKLASPVGLAAGFDKSADLVGGLSRLGFGYITVGSITRLPRAGNAKPRLGRIPEDQALVNAMGLPNSGLEASIRSLRHLRGVPIPIFVSVAGFNVDELSEAAAAVEPYADAVEIGLICPNTSAEEQLEEIDLFDRLLRRLTSQRSKPLFVKLPSYTSPESRTHVFAMVDMCIERGLEAVCVSASQRLKTSAIAVGEGSLTGRPTFAASVEHVREVAAHARGQIATIGAGGVFTGSDAYQMLCAGATTVELYSSFIYRGWSVAGAIKRELDAELRAAAMASVQDARPQLVRPSSIAL